MTKKIILLSTLLSLLLFLFACSKTNDSEKTIHVVATLEPHSTILESIRPQLEKKGYQLKITIVEDYYTPNRSVNDKEADANYFQHVPFFENEVRNHGYDLVNVASIHLEPFGLYSQSIKNLSELKNGAKIVISNSPSDNGRILNILKENNLISLKEGSDIIKASIKDIADNPKKLEFIEVKPELLTLAYKNNEGDLVAINGNYAISAGLSPTKDALFLEKANIDNPYVNIIACRKEKANTPKIKALVECLQSKETKDFIKNHYQDGSVIASSK